MSKEQDSPTLVIRRRIPATPEELFDAWTSPEGMSLWMCPGDIVSSEITLDLRVGGALLIRMQGPHNTYEHRGRFRTISPPAKLEFTWEAAATNYRPTLVTVEFLEISRSITELILTHQRFPSTERRDQYEEGWGQIIARLETYLGA